MATSVISAMLNSPIVTSVSSTLSEVDQFFSPSKIYIPSILTTLAVYLRDFVSDQIRSRGLFVRKFNFHDIDFWHAVVIIFLHPVIWNIIGRLEHNTKILSKIFRKPIYGVYAVALWIFVVGTYRDVIFNKAISNQQKDEMFDTPTFQLAGISCLVFGTILVFTSFYQLGFANTYLGDYFGILMNEKVTAFPFNFLDDPMYDGSSLVFLGKAILSKSTAGLFLSIWVYVVYRIISLFEGPFTAYIYDKRAKENKEKTS